MFNKILALCRKHDISISALERKLGFGNSTIIKWKESSPSVENLKKVTDYFGVSIDYLLDDTKEPVQ